MTIGRPTAGGVIKAIFFSQLVIGAVLVSRDLDGTFPTFDLGPDVPRLDEPVRPGDQTRRYRLPAAPGGTPFPSRSDMPPRLTLERRTDDEWSLTGEVAPGDAVRVLSALDREGVAALALNSPGGSVADALAIGRGLRERETVTLVDAAAICLSACPYMLAGGSERRISIEAHVGVHQHYFGESTILPAFLAVEDVQSGQAEVMDFLDAMDIDPLLMRHAMATPPDEIYLLVPDELTTYRLATEIVDRQ